MRRWPGIRFEVPHDRAAAANDAAAIGAAAIDADAITLRRATSGECEASPCRGCQKTRKNTRVSHIASIDPALEAVNRPVRAIPFDFFHMTLICARAWIIVLPRRVASRRNR